MSKLNIKVVENRVCVTFPTIRGDEDGNAETHPFSSYITAEQAVQSAHALLLCAYAAGGETLTEYHFAKVRSFVLR